MTEYRFPDGFWWGSASSAPQTEGTVEGDGRGLNAWDLYYELKPERFFDGVGPEDTSSFVWEFDPDHAARPPGHPRRRLPGVQGDGTPGPPRRDRHQGARPHHPPRTPPRRGRRTAARRERPRPLPHPPAGHQAGDRIRHPANRWSALAGSEHRSADPAHRAGPGRLVGPDARVPRGPGLRGAPGPVRRRQRLHRLRTPTRHGPRRHRRRCCGQNADSRGGTRNPASGSDRPGLPGDPRGRSRIGGLTSWSRPRTVWTQASTRSTTSPVGRCRPSTTRTTWPTSSAPPVNVSLAPPA